MFSPAPRAIIPPTTDRAYNKKIMFVPMRFELCKMRFILLEMCFNQHIFSFSVRIIGFVVEKVDFVYSIQRQA